MTGVTGVSVFSLNGQRSRSLDVKNLKEMTHGLSCVKVDFLKFKISKCCMFIAKRTAASYVVGVETSLIVY